MSCFVFFMTIHFLSGFFFPLKHSYFKHLLPNDELFLGDMLIVLVNFQNY